MHIWMTGLTPPRCQVLEDTRREEQSWTATASRFCGSLPGLKLEVLELWNFLSSVNQSKVMDLTWDTGCAAGLMPVLLWCNDWSLQTQQTFCIPSLTFASVVNFIFSPQLVKQIHHYLGFWIDRLISLNFKWLGVILWWLSIFLSSINNILGVLLSFLKMLSNSFSQPFLLIITTYDLPIGHQLSNRIEWKTHI